jgi:Domain of unknown function (DUF4266)
VALRSFFKIAAALAALSGCSAQKWAVKPNEREYLADRIMRFDSDPQAEAAEQHILTNREGAMGGGGTAGGGCGCN